MNEINHLLRKQNLQFYLKMIGGTDENKAGLTLHIIFIIRQRAR